MNPVISQFDLVTAYGWGLDAIWDGLMRKQTAIHATHRFKERKFISDLAAMVPHLLCPNHAPRVMAMLGPLLEKLSGKLDPATPLILATTVGQIEYVESAILDGSAELLPLAAPSGLLGQIKHHLGLTGPAMVVSSACASSAVALSRAASMVRCGQAPAVLVVACDAVSEFVYSGFSTLQSLCDTLPRPFDAHRCGLSLGEAAAWALVTPSNAAPIAGDGVSILGWASTSDAIHMTAPDRHALGLSRAIAGACSMANRNPAEISFIAAHGTATVYSDAMEFLAFRGAVPHPVPVFSIKGGAGHTLGAAGLVQILVSARALSRGRVPPTVGLTDPDASAAGWAHSSSIELSNPLIALSTNSGFGGVNTAIVLGQPNLPVPARSHRPVRQPIVSAVAWSLAGESTEEITALVGRPVKYLARMTPEARCCLVAACKAMRRAALNPDVQVGIVAAGEQGFSKANFEYFRDYVAGGQSMGRGSLFIYTLPTSAASEVAIALRLRGPVLHAQSDSSPVQGLISLAGQMLAEGETEAMLAMWSSPKAAVCFAVTLAGTPLRGTPLDLASFQWNRDPLAMAGELAASEKLP